MKYSSVVLDGGAFGRDTLSGVTYPRFANHGLGVRFH